MSFGNKKKTTMNKILFILCLTSASLWMLSCTDYEVASYPEENETEVFNGTVLDYLSTGNERLNLKFDSMMVLANNIPDFIQQMEQTDVQYTVLPYRMHVSVPHWRNLTSTVNKRSWVKRFI